MVFQISNNQIESIFFLQLYLLSGRVQEYLFILPEQELVIAGTRKKFGKKTKKDLY